MSDPDHAWNAVQSALDMDKALVDLNTRWKKTGEVELRMGVGIHTGRVFAGSRETDMWREDVSVSRQVYVRVRNYSPYFTEQP